MLSYGVLVLNLVATALALSYSEVTFVVLSQPHPYHDSLADRLKKDIVSQANDFHENIPSIWITSDKGSWTILPLLEKIAYEHSTSAKWVIFCDPHTSINLVNLHKVLMNHDPDEEIWIGHALIDLEPTIIHHFATSDEFAYPNFASGFAMSMALLRTLYHRFKEADVKSSTEFSIDPSYELSKFIWDNGNGSILTHSEEFCVIAHENCATYPKSSDVCGHPVSTNSIAFAVKTYHEYHQSRVKVVKNTWGKFAPHLLFFSDKNESAIPTIDVGVKNTKRGHCAKTMAILKYLNTYIKENPKIKWIILADDDTILSVSRLCEVLSCYGDKKIAIGERYGFNILNGNGYDYLTGGGSLALTVDLLPKLSSYKCPMPSSPDDMWLGVCLAKMNVPIIHSPLFHQARPVDYALEYLAPQRPVSFHKHWMIDPMEVYRRWFETDDIRFAKLQTDPAYHTEL